MSNTLLTDTIIERAKVIASVPLNQQRFSTDQLLQMLHEIVETELFPKLVGLGNGFNMRSFEVQADSDGYIDIPENTYMRGIQYIRVKDSEKYMLEISRTEADLQYNWYYFDGNRIKTDANGQTLEVTYILQPPTLRSQDEVPQVISFNPTTRQVEINFSNYNDPLDIISSTDGYPRAINVSRTTTTSPTIFTLSASDEDPQVGDYLPVTGESCIVPVPNGCATYLSRALANRVMADLTDDPNSLAVGLRLEKEAMNNLLDALTPRGRRSKVITSRPFINNRRRRYGRAY